MNHENIVRWGSEGGREGMGWVSILTRYYNAWIETFSEADFRRLSESHDVSDKDSSETESSDDSQDDTSESEEEPSQIEDGISIVEFRSDATSMNVTLPHKKQGGEKDVKTAVILKKDDEDDSEGEDIFTCEFSADFSSSNVLDIAGTTAGRQLEANLMDMSPKRLRRY